MRAPLIISIFLIGSLSLMNAASDADEPAQDSVTAECTVVRLPADLARQFSAEHDLHGDPPAVWAALQTLVQAQKAEVVSTLNITAKSHQRASGEQSIIKLVVESVPSAIPGWTMTSIVLSCANHTTTTHSNWKAHHERLLGPYESTWKAEAIVYLAFLRLRGGDANPGSSR